jgi:protein-S-isoprenylcysteine O-methyltransferase Ste14
MPYLLAAPLALLFRSVPSVTGRWMLASYVVAAGVGYSLAFLAATYWIILDQGERWWFVAIAKQRLGRLTAHTA